MIEGAAWRRWVFFNIPLILFVFVLLFPFYWMIITTFRPDGELYRPWNASNYMPFWTNNPTFEHILYLFEETNFARWMLNTMFIALVSTLISLFCGVLAGYALARLNFPYAGGLGTAIFITEDLIRATGGLVGTPDEIVAMLREREAMGLNEVTLLPAMAEARRNLDDFAKKVIARY